VGQEPPISAWALAHFGDDATVVRRGVVEALNQSQERAVLIQEMSGLGTKQPYGGMWPATYQALEEQLLSLPTAYKFRAPHASYNLVVVNDRLLLPFRYADNLNVPVTQARLATKIGQALSAALSAVEPPADLFSFLEDDGIVMDAAPASRELIHLDPATKIIYVPYVSHADAGLVKAWWGEALMQADGRLSWLAGQPEELPAAQRPAAGGLKTTGGPLVPGPAGAAPAFDEGDLPVLDFPARPRAADAPTSEPQPRKPTANDGDA
jgi:hypothetical protein